MKVLLHEGVPHPLVQALRAHELLTVDDVGCKGVKSGELLKIVAERQFQVLATADKRIPAQQNLSSRPFAILLLSTNNWPIMRNHVAAISMAIDNSKAGTGATVECGSFPSRSSQT